MNLLPYQLVIYWLIYHANYPSAILAAYLPASLFARRLSARYTFTEQALLDLSNLSAYALTPHRLLLA